MVFDGVVERFAQHRPITVMAPIGLERALDPQQEDELFERQRGSKYARELLISTTVEVMSWVALGLRPSILATANGINDLPIPMHSALLVVGSTTLSAWLAIATGASGPP